LKLKCDAPLSNDAFKFNLRRYIMAADLRAFMASSANSQRPVVPRPGARAELGSSADLLVEGYKDFAPNKCRHQMTPGVQCKCNFSLRCPWKRCGLGQHCPAGDCPAHKGKAAAERERERERERELPLRPVPREPVPRGS
jgi:hypothetical protein